MGGGRLRPVHVAAGILGRDPQAGRGRAVHAASGVARSAAWQRRPRRCRGGDQPLHGHVSRRRRAGRAAARIHAGAARSGPIQSSSRLAGGLGSGALRLLGRRPDADSQHRRHGSKPLACPRCRAPGCAAGNAPCDGAHRRSPRHRHRAAVRADAAPRLRLRADARRRTGARLACRESGRDRPHCQCAWPLAPRRAAAALRDGRRQPFAGCGPRRVGRSQSSRRRGGPSWALCARGVGERPRRRVGVRADPSFGR